MYVIICGLPASGKSTLGLKLSSIFNLKIISTDNLRKLLYAEEIYNSTTREETYTLALNYVKEHLSLGKSICVDATFYKKEFRKPFIEIAIKYKCKIWIIVCYSSNSIRHLAISRRKKGEFLGLNKSHLKIITKIEHEWEEPSIEEINNKGLSCKLMSWHTDLNSIIYNNFSPTDFIFDKCIFKINIPKFKNENFLTHYDIQKTITQQIINIKKYILESVDTTKIHNLYVIGSLARNDFSYHKKKSKLVYLSDFDFLLIVKNNFNEEEFNKLYERIDKYNSINKYITRAFHIGIKIRTANEVLLFDPIEKYAFYKYSILLYGNNNFINSYISYYNYLDIKGYVNKAINNYLYYCLIYCPFIYNNGSRIEVKRYYYLLYKTYLRLFEIISVSNQRAYKFFEFIYAEKRWTIYCRNVKRNRIDPKFSKDFLIFFKAFIQKLLHHLNLQHDQYLISRILLEFIEILIEKKYNKIGRYKEDIINLTKQRFQSNFTDKKDHLIHYADLLNISEKDLA